MPFELVPPGTKFDFIGKWKICAAISAVMIAIGLVGLWKPGARLGVDFAGGSEMQVRFTRRDAGRRADPDPRRRWRRSACRTTT